MKKIAFFDIDGTMVNVPNGMLEPSKETKRVLKEFQEQGNYIVVATARGSVLDSISDMNFDGYIMNDGHYIIFQDEILVDDIHTREEVEREMDMYDKYNAYYTFGGHGKEWNSFIDSPLMVAHGIEFQRDPNDTLNIIDTFTAEDVEAVSCCALFDTVEELKGCYEELKDQFTIVPYYTGLIRMDVYRKGYTKGTACEYVFEKLNIDRKHTYAFGDGVNDVEMLKLVGTGIAMGNGLDVVKEVADDITDTVDNEGIAKAFKKYFNI